MRKITSFYTKVDGPVPFNQPATRLAENEIFIDMSSQVKALVLKMGKTKIIIFIV